MSGIFFFLKSSKRLEGYSVETKDVAEYQNKINCQGNKFRFSENMVIDLAAMVLLTT